MKICLRSRRPTQLGSRLHASAHHGLTRSCHGPRLTQTANRWNLRMLNTRSWNRSIATSSLPSSAASGDFSSPGQYAAPRTELFDKQSCPIPTEQREDLNEWIKHLEPFLPFHLRHGVSTDQDQSNSQQRTSAKESTLHEGQYIANLLWHARRLKNFDLLAHLGFRLGRWPAVNALMEKLLNATDIQNEACLSNSETPSNLDWGSQSLDQITADLRDGPPSTVRDESSSRQSTSVARISLDALTYEPNDFIINRMIMSEVWQSLGFIVLEAADLPQNDAQMAMSFVYRALAHLHHSGAISDAVYRYSRPLEGEAPFRPPGMYLLSTHIMNVLSDAVWLVHEADVTAKAKAAGEDSPFRPFKMGIRHLGPEIWLEFVLWCCVEEGHVKEGVWILERMKKRKDDLAWHLISWKSFLEYPELIRDTDIDVADFWSHLERDQASKAHRDTASAFHGLGKRSISFEVVASLLDGVVNLVDQGIGVRGYPLTSVLQYIVFLNTLLARSTDGACQIWERYAGWHMVRMIESQGVDPQVEPRSLERVLKARPPPLPPWDDSTPKAYEMLDEFTKSDLYGSSSALTGLLEYNLQAYAANRQTGGAFSVYAWLQELIDLSKMQHVQGFWEGIQNLDSEELSQNEAPPHQPIHLNTSSNPQISNVTFADLLDLTTASRAFGFGEWLLFSTDADGSPIPLAAYGDQALAPSILRFAAATRNTELCNRVIGSLSEPVVRNTLKALMNFRITMGNWDQVEIMLSYLRQHKHKSWGDSNVTALAAAILRLSRSSRNTEMSDHEEKQLSLSRAEDLMVRILNGEFNSWSNAARRSVYQERILYRWHQMFSAIPGLDNVCQRANLKYIPPTDRDVLPYVPSVAFHLLLDAVVDIHGSVAGQRIWEQWCLDMVPPETGRLTEGGIFRLYEHAKHNFGQREPYFNAAWFNEVRTKCVIPNLNTVRIIARGAVKEYRHQRSGNSPTGQSSSSHADLQQPDDVNFGTPQGVLDFCVERYRRLRLDDKEIDREVQGHVSRMTKRQRTAESSPPPKNQFTVPIRHISN